MIGESSTVKLEPLIGQLHKYIRTGLRPEVLTTRPHTDLYLRGDFILMCFGNMVKTKEIQFLPFSRKIRRFWKNFLFHQLAKYDYTQSCKFHSLSPGRKSLPGS